MTLNFYFITDLIFPPTKEELLVRHTSAEVLLAKYLPRHFDHTTILLPFSDERVQALIHLAKYNYHGQAYNILAQVLNYHLQAYNLPPNTNLIPIPLSSTRWRERGYNQVTEVLKRYLRQVSHGSFILNKHNLYRTRNTKSQTKLDKKARTKNLKNAFALRNATELTNADLLLIDDVYTTGSTMNEAYKVLKQAKPKSLRCVALAG